MNDRNRGLTPEELADNEAADLPDREALTLLSPGSALSTGFMPPNDTIQPMPPEPGDGAQPITLPRMPLPADNPGGTYNPDASATSET